ncbi:MAG: hypothetical protein AB1798_13630 [Spirochaetota bacterium]
MPVSIIINPNTSAVMTARIRGNAEKVFQPPWSSITEMAPAGPESLESWRDYHLAAVCILPQQMNHPEKIFQTDMSALLKEWERNK